MHSPFVQWATLNLNFGATEIAACQPGDESRFGGSNNTLTEGFLPTCPALKPETLGWF